MGAAEAIGVAGSFSLLSGWRLYACVFVCGFAMKLGWLPVPEHLAGLGVLTSNWVLGLAAMGFVAEFFTDKLAWVDSAWDALHTLIRPVGGALLALAVIDPGNPTWQVVTVLLGGGMALSAHAAKAGTRAMLNASPEPFSNIVASTAEDGVTATGLYLAVAHPAVALVVVAVLAVIVAAMLWFSWKIVRRGWRAWNDRGRAP